MMRKKKETNRIGIQEGVVTPLPVIKQIGVSSGNSIMASGKQSITFYTDAYGITHVAEVIYNGCRHITADLRKYSYLTKADIVISDITLYYNDTLYEELVEIGHYKKHTVEMDAVIHTDFGKMTHIEVEGEEIGKLLFS